jgi:hypothetical protein
MNLSSDDDPNETTLEFMGFMAMWNSNTHMLVLTESRLGASIELNGLQVAALRAFLRGTAPE